ncbi:MAG: hypothetical protein LM558_00445 [Thermosphaera sp.]|nr:hypothetical protein [Thermosphaera sp.]
MIVVELTTVDSKGRVKHRVVEDKLEQLYDVAEEIMVDIEETLEEDMLEQLPRAERYVKVRSIDVANGFYYVIEWEMGEWEAKKVVRADRATYYDNTFHIYGGEFDLYVRAQALIFNNTLYYRVKINRLQLMDFGKELRLLAPLTGDAR